MTAIKIIAELRRFKDLQAYSDHPKIAQAKFQNGYKTKMTFGLHAGSAIEGAIGSEFKMDALYLSQDQMISLRLEQLCQDYKATILASEAFFKELADNSQDRFRQVDRIMMDELQKPPEAIRLYACDIVEQHKD